MNSKVLFVAALGVAALGYYAYDADIPGVSGAMRAVWGTPTVAGKKLEGSKTSKAPQKRRAETAADDSHPVPAVAPQEASQPEINAAPAEKEEAAAVATPADDAPPAAQTKPELAAAGAARVADVLATLPLVKDVTPNTEARYYIYLMSAGWCGPCNQEMPHIVEAYAQMKEAGVAELILVDFDDTPEAARAYMDKYGAEFPAIMKDLAPSLPGMQPPAGIPCAFIVDAMGNMVVSGHGSITRQWREHIAAYEQKNGLPSSLDDAAADEAGEDIAPDASRNKPEKRASGNAVAKALRKVKWTEGRPNRRAKYYIYYQSASWCGPCCQLMPSIVEEYQAMKKDGRVELIHISYDDKAAAAKKYYSSNKAAFPMVIHKSEGVSQLPGWAPAQGIPHAIIVDSAGTVIADGNGAIVREWRRYTIEQEDRSGSQQ